ncbi:hypothetical protein F2Q69_00022533 [Brassica cretica]|uniref:Uncharacterized protein n=1 Tax=Brassica cretica TaxID=69181 RepID=A0A8S9QP57_BRACR|nr:hypothetical protein F2Q69_00022533 [Brassica cretica]
MAISAFLLRRFRHQRYVLGGDPSQQRNHALEVTPTTLFMYQNVCLRSKI